jgi:hypothetical protein
MRSLGEKRAYIAGLCGVPTNTAIHASRNLPPPYWPRPGRGEKDVFLPTTAAVGLALALSGPPGESGSYAKLVGDLRRSSPAETFSSLDEQRERHQRMQEAGASGDLTIEDMVFAPTVMGTLVRLTDRLRGPERNELLPQISNFSVEIVTAVGGAGVFGIWVRIRCTTASGRRVGFFYENPAQQLALTPDSESRGHTAIREIKLLRGNLFLGLADMLRDDAARRSGTPPRIENPATSAVAADAAGSSNDQPAAGDRAPRRRKLGASNIPSISGASVIAQVPGRNSPVGRPPPLSHQGDDSRDQRNA